MKLLYNARFYLDGNFNNLAQALLVEWGRIMDILYHLPRSIDAEKVDLGGGFAYPGFIDAHTHSFSGGLYADGIDLSDCRSISDVLDLLELADRSGQETIFAWRLDENNLLEKRFPTLKELDSVCPKVRLLLRRVDGHSCMLNSAARRTVPGLESPDEVLTGTENDLAVNWLQDNCDEQTILKAYHTAARVALKGGFTAVHTMIGDADQSIQHYRLIQDHLSEFPVQFHLYPQSFNFKAALEVGAKRIGGCILADGSIGSFTAALSTPYKGTRTTGRLYHPQPFWKTFIRQAIYHKLEVAVHCIGDRAIKQLCEAFCMARSDRDPDLRHQIIHCELVPSRLIDVIKGSGATAVMQPNFDLLWGGKFGMYDQRLGAQRRNMMNRFHLLRMHGIRVCGSSDWYVTDMDIAMSLSAAIWHNNRKERLKPWEAIKIYTENNAWLNHDENRLGIIKAGFQADLSVLDTDFTNHFEYEDCHTLAIIRKGVKVYAGT